MSTLQVAGTSIVMMLILIGLPISVLYLFATAATVWILFVLAAAVIHSAHSRGDTRPSTRWPAP